MEAKLTKLTTITIKNNHLYCGDETSDNPIEIKVNNNEYSVYQLEGEMLFFGKRTIALAIISKQMENHVKQYVDAFYKNTIAVADEYYKIPVDTGQLMITNDMITDNQKINVSTGFGDGNYFSYVFSIEGEEQLVMYDFMIFNEPITVVE